MGSSAIHARFQEGGCHRYTGRALLVASGRDADRVPGEAGTGGPLRRRAYASRAADFLDWLSSSAEPSTGGDPLTEARARDIAVAAGLVHDTGTEAGEARAHHHTLRRTFSAQLLRNGVDKVTVADLTGHTTSGSHHAGTRSATDRASNPH